MTLICGDIAQNFVLDCASKPVGGVKSRLHIMNSDDIASVTYDTDNPIIVRGITLKPGKRAWTWDVYKRNHKPKFEVQDAPYSTNFKHSLVSYIPEWNNDTKLQAEQLTCGFFVVVCENLQNTTDAAFEIYGLKSGIRASTFARDLATNEGVPTLTMTNDPDMFEDHMPASFAVLTTGGSPVYSYALTAAALVALETPAS